MKMKYGIEYTIIESLLKCMYYVSDDLLKESSYYTGLFLYKLQCGKGTQG